MPRTCCTRPVDSIRVFLFYEITFMMDDQNLLMLSDLKILRILMEIFYSKWHKCLRKLLQHLLVDRLSSRCFLQVARQWHGWYRMID
jgi:hypothetical protein